MQGRAVCGLTVAVVATLACLPASAVLPQMTPGSCASLGGCEIWEQADGTRIGTAFALSPDGSRVFVAGTLGNAGFVRALSAATGAVQWTRTVPLAPQALAVAPDGGRVFVSGPVSAANPGSSAISALVASTGVLSWTMTEPGVGGLAFRTYPVAVSADGATVYSTERPAVANHRIVARTAAAGATTWSAQFSASAGAGDSATVLAPAPDGRLFAAGHGVLKAFTTAGATLWTSVTALNTPDLAVSGDSAHVYLSGWGADARLRSYAAATGAIESTVTLAGGPGSDDTLGDLLLSRDGRRVALGGTTRTSGADDQRAMVAAVDVAGGALSLDWVAFTRLPDTAWKASVAFAPDDRGIYYAGTNATLRGEVPEIVAFADGAVASRARVADALGYGGFGVLASPQGDRVYFVAQAIESVAVPAPGLRVAAWGGDAPAQVGLLDVLQADAGGVGDAGDSEDFPTSLPVRGATIGPFSAALLEADDGRDAYRIPLQNDGTSLTVSAEPLSTLVDVILVHIGPNGVRTVVNDNGAGYPEQIAIASAIHGGHTITVTYTPLSLATGTQEQATYVMKGTCFPHCSLPT